MIRKPLLGIALGDTTLQAFAQPRSAKKNARPKGASQTVDLAIGNGALAPWSNEELSSLEQALASTLPTVARKGTPLALSLPETTGRTLWLHLPEAGANATERQEMARWRLKDRLPLPAGQLRLSVQAPDPAAPDRPALITLLPELKARQLEELCDGLGYPLLHLNFHPAHLWHAMGNRVLTTPDYLLVLCTARSLTWGCVRRGRLTGFRQKQGRFTPEQAQRETARTLGEWQQQEVSWRETEPYLYIAGEDGAPLREKLAPLLPDLRLLDRTEEVLATAARGAADRMRGV